MSQLSGFHRLELEIDELKLLRVAHLERLINQVLQAATRPGPAAAPAEAARDAVEDQQPGAQT